MSNKYFFDNIGFDVFTNTKTDMLHFFCICKNQNSCMSLLLIVMHFPFYH